MRRLAALLLLLAAVRPSGAVPRLLVVVSVDQLRGDFVDRYRSGAAGGFKELFERGALFTDAHHAHVPTETGPGHAVILTGKYPNETGIAANDWWDRRAGAEVYCVADAVHGLGPQNLETYTLGDALKAKDPLAQVVSVSVKDRSAVLMGGLKADAAVWFSAGKGEFVTSTYYARPDWLEELNARLKKGVLAPWAGRFKDFRMDPDADRAVLELAERAVRERRLGSDAHPDVLAVGFSATDYIGHQWGPDSPQMKEQMKRLDALLGELIGFLNKQVGREHFALALTADHGVLPMPESEAGKALGARRILNEDLDKRVEGVLQALHPAPGQKWLIGEKLFPNLYLNRALAQKQGLAWSSLLRETAAALRKIDGLAQVYVPEEWDRSDAFSEAYERGYFPGRSGDLIARQAENVLIAFDKTSTSHGSPYRYDTHVPLIFLGSDFKAGFFSQPAKVTDLAPTLAKALGVEFPPAAGSRVLTESLAAP